jgi:hypothetical protein
LVQNGADVNAKECQGNTPLHLAAAKGHTETVDALLSLGARPGETNAAGKVPGEVALSRRIARAIAGLGRDLAEEQREDLVTGELRGEGAEASVPSSAGGSARAADGEFFDATRLYGLQFSSDEERSAVD